MWFRSLVPLASLVLASSIGAQTPAPLSPAAAPQIAPATTATGAPAPGVQNPKLHADALQLAEVAGVRKQIEAGIPGSLLKGVNAMKDHCPNCTDPFYSEWTRRMTARINLDELVAVYVEAYEKYLSDDEIVQLTSLQREALAGHTSEPSDALKTRLAAVMPNLIGETSGRISTIGARLGATVGAEIGAEHPEYLGVGAQVRSKP